MKRRMVIAGGSGFLGRLVEKYFLALGWEVIVLSRRPRARDVYWDGRSIGEWAKTLNGAEAIINLAGRSVNCRYGPKNRQEILESRVESTRAIGEAIAKCSTPPRVWLNASTATIYRHTFGAPWGEDGEIGGAPEVKDEFSIEVARAWERELDLARTPGTRKVALRAAMVLGTGQNSVFPVLRRLARLGLGGKMGDGKQFVSWIHERDFCRALEWIIEHPDLSGPINIAAPNPATNAEMMRQLRRAVGAPIGLPAAEWMLEIGAFLMRTETELILKSRRVIPKRLLKSGFKFEFEEMGQAMRRLANEMSQRAVHNSAQGG